MGVSSGAAGMPMLPSLALKIRAPEVCIDTRRLLPVSDTQMLPSGATVTPHGTLKPIWCPVPVVLLMGAFQTPEADMLWMRLFNVSATQTVPSGATAIPVGLLRSPGGEVTPVPF